MNKVTFIAIEPLEVVEVLLNDQKVAMLLNACSDDPSLQMATPKGVTLTELQDIINAWDREASHAHAELKNRLYNEYKQNLEKLLE